MHRTMRYPIAPEARPEPPRWGWTFEVDGERATRALRLLARAVRLLAAAVTVRRWRLAALCGATA